MIKRFVFVWLIVFTGCVIVGPPEQPQPAVWDFSVSVSDTSGQLQPSATVTVGQYAKTTNDFGWAYLSLQQGCYTIRVEKAGFVPYAPGDCLLVDRHKRLAVSLVSVTPPTPRLTTDHQIFRQDGHPWRWKGVTAFGLANQYCSGTDITPFLDAFKGFNVLRVFLAVPWEGTGWQAPDDGCLRRFMGAVAQRGFYVELTLFTDNTPISDAQSLTDHYFALLSDQPNVMIELVNEPQAYEKVNPDALHIPATALLWASGCYDFTHSDCMRGSYGVSHNPRDGEWPRKAHDLLEYYHGGGPGAPSDLPHPYPQIGDEPAKLQDVGGCNPADWEAYFGVASLLGAGATYHFESGKYGHLPTPDEAVCAGAALRALDFYPAEAPLGPYSHNTADEQATGSLRTYTVGAYTVRVRPTSGAPVLQPY